jgi:hypothetical protein
LKVKNDFRNISYLPSLDVVVVVEVVLVLLLLLVGVEVVVLVLVLVLVGVGMVVVEVDETCKKRINFYLSILQIINLIFKFFLWC